MCVDGGGKLTVNTGTHVLSLYCAPVPDVRTMVSHFGQQRCGHASIKLRICIGDPRSSCSTSSEDSDSDVDADDDADTEMCEVSGSVVHCLSLCIVIKSLLMLIAEWQKCS